MQCTMQAFVKGGIETTRNSCQGSLCLSRESNQVFSEYKSEALLFYPPYSILNASFCGSALTYVYFAYFNFPTYVSNTRWGWVHIIKKDRFKMGAVFKMAVVLSTSWSRYFVRVEYIIKRSMWEVFRQWEVGILSGCILAYPVYVWYY